MIAVGFREAQVGLCPFHSLDGCCWSKQCAHVDEHVEEREARVAATGIAWVVVEVAHHHLQVALKQAGSEAHEQQGCHHGCHSCHVAAQRHRQQQIAKEHDYDAYHHHFAVAPAVGGDTAKQGQEVNQG